MHSSLRVDGEAHELARACCARLLPVGSPADSPVYKLVLLQILATLCDVSSYVEKVHHGQTGRMLLITEAENLKAAEHIGGETVSTNLAGGLTGRGLVSLMKVFRSPPVISSSKINLGMACRLTPTHLTMFWWLNLLQRQRCRLVLLASFVPLAG